MSVVALIERLTLAQRLNLVVNSDKEAASVSSKLRRIQVGLQEAERIGDTDYGIKYWLKELEDVVYEMDNVLDELETANLQVEVQDTSLNWDKLVCSLLYSPCLCFKQIISRREIALKMKALSARIDTILIEKERYTFVSSGNDRVRAQEFKPVESTRFLNENVKLYGLDHVSDSLVDKLISEGQGGDDDDDTQVISIVGLGGVGKTTLARVAYNDPRIDGLFAPKGWVSVSQAFNASDIAKAILESFGEHSDDARNLDALVQRIRYAVHDKRFLLVLDNVWVDDRSKWDMIKQCFHGGKGSRIVVTTRHESVARMMGTTHRQSLGLLSDIDCAMIVNGVALKGRAREESEELRGIGMEIAKKCNGLPLAARSVGSILASRSNEREWRAVLESPLWRDEDEASDLFRILNLSYMDLSPVLKRCLLSSVVFPKGSSLSVDEISRVWMAYGYLSPNGSVDEVQKGFQYLNNLAMRSFFQKVASDNKDDDRELYKMSDIMHDFATYVSAGNDEYSFIREGGLEKDKSPSSHDMLPRNFGRLRTFSVWREELRLDIVSHLTSVRILSMRECNLEGLPQDIGKLIHLRYLNVSDNPIFELPETITGLCNLQTLDIGRCRELSSLPEGIGKLINLRHLVNTDTIKLVEFPQGLEKLTGLRTLSEFRGRKVGYLRNLNQLQGSLSLFLQNLDKAEIGDLNLWKKQHLEKLQLEFGEEEQNDEVVEALNPPPNLQKLVMFSSSGKWLSHWIPKSLDNLKLVWFHGYRKCSNVPPFCKLPALEELAMYACGFERLSMAFLGIEDASSSSSIQVAAGFPRLKRLCLEGCPAWKMWEDIEEEVSVPPIMPLLEELEISDCRSLEAMPHRLIGKATSLRVVKLLGSPSLYERYNKISGYDRDKMPLLPYQMWTVA